MPQRAKEIQLLALALFLIQFALAQEIIVIKINCDTVASYQDLAASQYIYAYNQLVIAQSLSELAGQMETSTRSTQALLSKREQRRLRIALDSKERSQLAMATAARYLFQEGQANLEQAEIWDQQPDRVDAKLAAELSVHCRDNLKARREMLQDVAEFVDNESIRYSTFDDELTAYLETRKRRRLPKRHGEN